MNGSYKKILLITDGNEQNKSAEENALFLAKRDGASVIIADTIRIQGKVEKWLVRNSEEMFESFKRDKIAYLGNLKKEFQDQGVDASCCLLQGRSSDVICRHIQRENCDLLVRYRKGPDSSSHGQFGKTAVNLLRVCPCPSLFVASGQNVENANVLACVDVNDDRRVTDRIMESAKQINKATDCDVHILYCWFVFGQQMMKRRMNEEAFDKMIKDIESENKNSFEAFLKPHDLSSISPLVHIEYGHPETVIPFFVDKNAIDVVVMSTAAADTPASRLLGSTIEHLINVLPASLLAVKAEGFVSPIRLAGEHSDEVILID